MLQVVTIRTLEDRRMSLLIAQLREEGRSQSDIARMLGISQSMVSALATGVRQVGLKVLRAAEARLKIPRTFFTDPELGDRPRYRDHVRGRGTADDGRQAVRDAVARWLAALPEGLVAADDLVLLEETLPSGVSLSERTIQSLWQDILDERRRERSGDTVIPAPARVVDRPTTSVRRRR